MRVQHWMLAFLSVFLLYHRVCKITTIFLLKPNFCSFFFAFSFYLHDGSAKQKVANVKPAFCGKLPSLPLMRWQEKSSATLHFLPVWNDFLSVCRIFVRNSLYSVKYIWCFRLTIRIFAVLIERNAQGFAVIASAFAKIYAEDVWMKFQHRRLIFCFTT